MAIFLLSLIIGFLNILHVVLGAIKTPPGTIYLGSQHYLPDYFNFLSLIFQGQKGQWTLINYFTSEPMKGYFAINWPYVIIGKIAAIFSFSPQLAYALAVAFGGAFVFFLAFLVVRLCFEEKKSLILPALFLFIFSGPFYELKSLFPPQVKIFSLTWYWRATFFDRLTVIPHYIFSSIFVYFLFFFSGKLFSSFKKGVNQKVFVYFSTTIVFFLLIMSVTPIKLVFLLPAFVLSLFYVFLSEKRTFSDFLKIAGLVLVLFLVLVSFAFYLKSSLSETIFPEVLEWERSAMEFPSLKTFFRGVGPLFLLFPLALIYLFVKKEKIHPVLFFGLVSTIFSFSLFFTKISLLFNNHNSRLIFSEGYLFLSVLLILAISSIFKEKAKKFFWLFALIIIFSFPSTIFSLKQRGIKDPDFSDYFYYFPQKIIEGFKFIDREKEMTKIVLTAQSSDIGIVLPIFARANVYAGRKMATIDFDQKALSAEAFFQGLLKPQDAAYFLKKNKINYIVWSSLDDRGGDPQKMINPPFLRPELPIRIIFANEMVMIFRVI